MRRGKTMSWCCLTLGNDRSAREIDGCARDDDDAKRYQKSAALPNFMRRTTPVEPSEPVEPAEPILYVIKGRSAPWANPEP